MKKLILFLYLSIQGLLAHGQFYVDVAPVMSVPVRNPFIGGSYETAVYTGPAGDFFPSIAGLGVGGTLGFRYRNGKSSVGLQLSYAGYNDKTTLVHVTMFQSVIQAEYYFNDELSRWRPYLGLNVGIFQPKYTFDASAISSIPLAQSFFGGGARGGVTYEIRSGHALYTEVTYDVLSLSSVNFRIGYLIPLGLE